MGYGLGSSTVSCHCSCAVLRLVSRRACQRGAGGPHREPAVSSPPHAGSLAGHTPLGCQAEMPALEWQQSEPSREVCVPNTVHGPGWQLSGMCRRVMRLHATTPAFVCPSPRHLLCTLGFFSLPPGLLLGLSASSESTASSSLFPFFFFLQF